MIFCTTHRWVFSPVITRETSSCIRREQVQRPTARSYSEKNLNGRSPSNLSPHISGNPLWEREWLQSQREWRTLGPLNQLSKVYMGSQRQKSKAQGLHQALLVYIIVISLVFYEALDCENELVSDFCACTWDSFSLLELQFQTLLW